MTTLADPTTSTVPTVVNARAEAVFLRAETYALTARPAQAQRWLDQLRRTDAARLPGMEVQLALAEATIAMQRDDFGQRRLAHQRR